MIVRLILNTLIILLTAYILPGVVVDNFLTAIFVAIVLGIINTFLRPVLVLLTIPVTVITLGLFLLVINAVLVLLASAIVPGFSVDGFFQALLFSIITSLGSSALSYVFRE